MARGVIAEAGIMGHAAAGAIGIEADRALRRAIIIGKAVGRAVAAFKHITAAVERRRACAGLGSKVTIVTSRNGGDAFASTVGSRLQQGDRSDAYCGILRKPAGRKFPTSAATAQECCGPDMGQYAGRKDAAARQPVTDVSGDCCRRYPTLQGGSLDDGGSSGGYCTCHRNLP